MALLHYTRREPGGEREHPQTETDNGAYDHAVLRGATNDHHGAASAGAAAGL